jgi:hypothetical protein
MPPLGGQSSLAIPFPASSVGAPAGEMAIASVPVAETTCPMCSETIKATAKRCKHCGATLDLALAQVENSALAASGKGGAININVVNQNLSQPYVQTGAGYAVTGMTLAIIGCPISLVPFCGWPVGMLLALLGLVYSSIGLFKARHSGHGVGMAITGLTLSLLTFLWGPFVFFVLFNLIQVPKLGPNLLTPNDGNNANAPPQKGTLQLRFAPGQRYEGMEIFIDNLKVPMPTVIGNTANLPVDKGQRTVAIRAMGQEHKGTLNVESATTGPTPFDVPMMTAK